MTAQERDTGCSGTCVVVGHCKQGALAEGLRGTCTVVPTKQWSLVLIVKTYLVLIFHHIFTFGIFWIFDKPLVFFQHFFFCAKEVYNFSLHNHHYPMFIPFFLDLWTLPQYFRMEFEAFLIAILTGYFEIPLFTLVTLVSSNFMKTHNKCDVMV